MPTHRWGDYTPSGHLGRILDDKTPQLGGMLDGNGFTFNGAVAFEAQAGEALSKGNAVYVSGVSGNKPVVMKADADDAAKMPAFGIAETDANLNANVNVVTFGTVYEIDTSAYSAGDELYVSTTAGALTATKPTGATAKLQNIGKVIRSHASAGSIKVGGAGRTNAVPNLDNGTVFIGDSNNQAEQRALVEADISDFGTYLTAESDTLDSVTDRGATTTNAITVGNLTSTGIDDNATSTAITLSSSGNVTIGTPSQNTHELAVREATSPRITIDDTGGSDTSVNAALLFRADTTNKGVVGYTGTDDLYVENKTAAGSVILGTADIDRLVINSSGTVSIQNGSGSGSNGNLTLTASSSGNEGGQINFNTVSSGTFSIDAWQDNLRFLNGTSAGDYYWYKNSNSGIGMTLTGAGDLDVDGVITADDVIVDVPSGSSGGFYGSSTNFGLQISDGGVGGKTVRLLNNGSTIFFHNQVENVIDLNTDVEIDGTLNVLGGSIDLTDDESPSLPVSIVSTGTLGNGGTYSPLKQSGQLQYSATSHLFADNDIVTSGYPGAWFEVDGGFRFGMGSAEKVAINGNGLQIGGSGIGSRANSLSVVGDDNSSTIASKTTSYATVFSVLPWSGSTTYLGTGTYYDDGAWVHASDNTTSSLLALTGSGVHWYASSGSTPNFDVASNLPLWNASGQWDGDINTNYDINTGSITVGDGSSTASHIAIKPADDTDADDLQFYNGTTRIGEIGTQDTTWLRINQETAKNIYTPRYIRADGGFFVDGTAKGINGSGNFIGGTVTTPSLTAEVASGPAIYIKDTSGTGATNHNSWLSFRDSAGTELGYVGYGSSGDSNLSLSNYNNGVVNIQGTKATVITSTGYIDIGSLNTSHAHFYTDRGSYYFNKLTYIDGSGLRGYDNSTDCRFPLYYDLQDTSYYCDPASTSRFNINYSNNHSTVAGNGYGLRFWNSDSYKIYMSQTGDATWGGQANGQNTSDYNMYFRMTSGTNRGFVFQNPTTGKAAAIDGNARGYFERVHIHDGQNANGGLTTGSTYLDVKYNATGGGGIRLFDSEGTINTYLYGAGNGEGGLLDNDGSWFCRSRTGTSPNIFYCNGNAELYVYTSYVRAIASFRAPIFYDMDNTTYYADFSSTGDSIRAAGDIVAYYSDERLKNIEGPIENALDKVSTLNGFYYRGNEKAQKLGYDDKLKVGLSAQDVQKVLPEIIKSCPADNRYMTLDYSKVVPLLVEAIKELKSEIEELKK